MDTAMSLILLGLAVIFAGALTVFLMSLLEARSRFVGWTALAFLALAALLVVPVCAQVLISGKGVGGELGLFRIEALNASFHFGVDRLSAFFMMLIFLLALPVTLFSIPYMEKERELVGYYGPLLLFVMGMAGVLCVDDLFFFFIPWEFMSLSAYALILFEKDDPQALRAAIKYFIVTHFGNVCIFVAAFIVYFCLPGEESSFLFPAISRSMGIMLESRPALLNLSLGLFFIGFATKAGIFPFGFLWLPDAHPAAPSPVSSILSGLMIKIGVYGMLRVFLDFLPPGPTTAAWGWAIAIFGTLSLFLGTLRAMMQHDSKILLAYHSIGQMGYIWLGFGLGMVFMEKVPVLAMAALVAGLYHLMNHACFKGLLFLNAGAVVHRTGIRDMDRLGGLSKLMPVTSAASLVAVLSIGGLPGFNGFGSKWMIYQTSIFGGLLYPWTVLMGIAAIFISVVTIVSVLKFFSTQFLGKIPEAFQEMKAGEDWAIQIPQVFLALACLLFGLVPMLGIFPAFCVFSDLPALHATDYGTVFGEFGLFRIVLHTETAGEGIRTIGIWNPMLTMLVFTFLGFLGFLLTRSAGAERRRVDNWFCGSVVSDEEVIYRSSSYYVYLKTFFGLVNREFVPSKVEIKTDFSRILNLDTWLYYPFCSGFLSLCRWFARSHVGITQVYLIWTVVGALITIAFLFLL